MGWIQAEARRLMVLDPYGKDVKTVPLFKKKPVIHYDPERQEPAIRKSICTGEMTAGFIDRETGRFQEWMRIRTAEEFEAAVGRRDIRIIY